MKQMTEDDLRRLALEQGAELSIDGKTFNASRAQVAARRAVPDPVSMPAEPAVEPMPAAPPEPAFTADEVRVMLAEQEARILKQLTALLTSMNSSAPVAPAEADEAESCLVATGFVPEYDKSGAIKFVGVQWERVQ